MEASEFSSVHFNKTLKAAKSQKFLNKLINTNNTTLLNARLKMLRWKIDDIWSTSIYFALYMLDFKHTCPLPDVIAVTRVNKDHLLSIIHPTPHKKGCITFKMPGMHEAIRDIKSK